MEYTFFEVAAIAINTKRIVTYVPMGQSGRIENLCDCIRFVDKKDNYINLELSMLTQKSWEVEPEVIYVWGACDEDGYGSIYKNKPIKTGDDWSGSGADDHLKNIFPKDKPQKFKIVPVED